MNYEEIANSLRHIRLGQRELSAAEDLLRTLKQLNEFEQEIIQLLGRAGNSAEEFSQDIAESLYTIRRQKQSDAESLEECIRILRRNIEGGW